MARRPLLALPLALLAAALVVFAAGAGQVGKPFPGFLTWPFDYVAWGGRPSWHGPQALIRVDERVEAVDGRPVARPGAWLAEVRAAPPGTAFAYTLRGRDGVVAERRIASQPFGWADFAATIGVMLLVAALYLAVGATAYALRPAEPAARALLAWTAAIAAQFVTLADGMGPQLLPEATFLATALLVAASWHLAMVFPRPFTWSAGRPRLAGLGYALVAPLGPVAALAYAHAWRVAQAAPAWLLEAHRAALAANVAAFGFMVGALVWKALRAKGALVAAQGRVVFIGLALGFFALIVGFIGPYLLGVPNPVWHLLPFAMLLTALFPAAIAVAIVRYDLFELNLIIKRTATYALSTALALAAYVALSWGFNLALAQLGLDALAQAAATAIVALSFATVHAQVRRTLDRVFDRAAYDLGAVVADFTLAARESVDAERLTHAFADAVDGALRPRWLAVDLAELTGLPAGRLVQGLPDDEAIARLAQPGPEDLAVALRVGPRELGRVVLGPRRSDRAYTSLDRRLVESLGQALALSAHTAALFRRLAGQERLRRELEIAQEVQMGLLPKDPPRPPDLDLALGCTPAQEVGGDFYDVVRLDETRWGVIVGDVAGKGVPASLMMALTLAFFRATSPGQASPAATLGALNRLIGENRPNKKLFVTAVYAVYDAAAGTVAIANAGMPRPLLDGAPLAVKGLPLGAARATRYPEVVVDLAQGASLALYSDGLEDLEAPDGAQLGPTWVEAFFRAAVGQAPAAVAAKLAAETAAYAAGTPQADDLTIALLRRRTGGTRELTVPEAASSIGGVGADERGPAALEQQGG